MDGGLVTQQSFWSPKKGTRLSNFFFFYELSSDILGPAGRYNHSWEKDKQINTHPQSYYV